MRISHVIKTDRWRSDPLICRSDPLRSASHFVVSRRRAQRSAAQIARLIASIAGTEQPVASKLSSTKHSRVQRKET